MKGSYVLLPILLSVCIFYLPIINISSASPSNFAQNFREYRGNGLSFEYPQGWAASASGDEYLGNLSIRGPVTRGSDACIFLAWMRDPGIAPEKILDQVDSAYSGSEMKILSSQRGTANIHGGHVSTLDLQYALRNSGTRKHFAVWNSSLSDRLFFATFSNGDEGDTQNTSRDASAFYRMLETFSDLPEREAKKLESRSEKGDVWAVVLGDLLASYSYKDAIPLPNRKIYLQTVHSLLPSKGIYLLSSKDQVSADPLKTIISRAGAVQELLNRAGYATSLIQAKGNIFIAVQDASGRWQPVSLNPKEPGRIIGVLIDNVNEGIIYENISDLASDNPIEFNSRNINNNIDDDSFDEIIHKDCEPSRYVELWQPSSENKSWMNDLQKALDRYDYGQSYTENIFDCSNTAQMCWSILRGKGYDSRLMMSYKSHSLDPHMWVVVQYPYDAERYVAVETASTDKNKRLVHLGRITAKADYYKGVMYNSSMQFSRLHPEEGMWLKF